MMPAVLTAPGEAAGGAWPVAVAGRLAGARRAAPLPALAPAEAWPAATAAPRPRRRSACALALALRAGRRRAAEPDALRVPGAVAEGAGLRPPRRATARALLAGGLAYTAGVVLSFVALAALLLALRAGGEQLGWGFQLQSPVVVAVLAALFTLIGLNLAGVFEFGSVLPDRVATAQARHPLVDSALTGVLAVAVAAPCTAPFMGASLGLAVTLPGAQALAVFAALGLGMALPYLAASAWPAVARALPRPGAWMATFKTPDGLPDVRHRGLAGLGARPAGRHRRRGGAARRCWWRWPSQPGRWARRRIRRVRARVWGAVGIGAAAALSLAWVGPALRQPAQAAAGSVPADDALAALVARARGRGQRRGPAGVRRLHRRLVRDLPVQQAHHAGHVPRCKPTSPTASVLLLRADWTRRDAAISAELTRLGRSGVPVYALYAPGTRCRACCPRS